MIYKFQSALHTDNVKNVFAKDEAVLKILRKV